MPSPRPEQDFGAYSIARAWLVCWRWRLAGRLGGDQGLRLSRTAAMSAARRRLRQLKGRERA